MTKTRKILLSLLTILSFVSTEAQAKRALLIVDVQNDFCPGGSLAVKGGNEIVPIINRLIKEGRMGKYDLIIASQDWHPKDHGSFASNHPGAKVFTMGALNGEPQMMWPNHCVQGTNGAKFHAGLGITENADASLSSYDTENRNGVAIHVQRKGTRPIYDSYSAFMDHGGQATGLMDYLQDQGVTELEVCGLATDYCVGDSALDAKKMAPDMIVTFLEYASRGIDPKGIAKKKAAMRKAKIAIASR